MRGIWAEMWRSPARATLVGLVLSAVIASVLYGFNWHTFYDTRTNFARKRAELIAHDVATLALATSAAPGHDDDFRKTLDRYLSPRRQLITVSRINKNDGKKTEWSLTSGTPVDESRSLVAEDFGLDVAGGIDGGLPVHVDVRVGIRPRFVVALTRAWTLSLSDYINDSEHWWSESLYNRSIPLYGYLLTIMIVGFGTIRAIYRDQQELLRLDMEAREIAAELGRLQEQHADEIAVLSRQVESTLHQRDDAISNRDMLEKEIAGIEREYQELIDTSSALDGEDPRLQETAIRKTQVERVLASYNVKVAYYEREYEKNSSELGAAEQLLQEVEDRREGLTAKLQDRNREIRKLHGLVLQTQKEMRSLQSDRLQSGTAHIRELREWEESQDSIEEQLGFWLKTGGHANVNFSSHSRVGFVEEQYRKIDPVFIDRYFTHVNNSEYERGARRLIRVMTDGSDDIEFSGGKLIIALDDDAGRTLGLRFETRRDAPDPVHVGFVLALLLRAKCRDFYNYSIRTR
ncbi:MAG: hypothetical protein JRJ68_12075 [Deltaproteobacteria bacterium]|nr:hypothetical protein [Deltaproteobacteria bacterium]